MTPSPEISAYFREIQKKGVASKLARTTPEQRRRHAVKMNKARWATNKAKKTLDARGGVRLNLRRSM